MNNSKAPMADELLSNQVTAGLLAELLTDKTPEQWSLWLQNNRNQSRQVPYRIPFVKMAGGVFYRREELGKYAEWEKMRQIGTIKLTGRAAEALQAVGYGTPYGSTTGRKLKVSAIAPQVDQATAKHFVQIVTTEPLMVWRLEPDEARALSTELIDVVKFLDRNDPDKKSQAPDPTKWKTATDAQYMKIERKVQK